MAVRELAGWAEVIEMGGVQGGNTRNILAHLDEWVISRDPDIVHLNAGLHDMARDPGPGPENRVPLDEYRANLERILQTLQRDTRAALILGLTTPVDLGRQLATAKGVNRTPEDVAAYNAAVREIAAGLGVAVNDLHAAWSRAAPRSCWPRTASISPRPGTRFSGAPSPPRCGRPRINLGENPMKPRVRAGIRGLPLLAAAALFASQAAAHFPEDTVHQLFQFPRDQVPVMDGDLSDWDMLPAEYIFDLEKYTQHKEQTSTEHNPADLNIVRAAAAWNDELNRLYFMAEVYDDVVRFHKEDPDSLDHP